MSASHKHEYASVRRVDGIESRIEAMADAIASQSELIAELRARLLPTPVDVGYRQQSPVVRVQHGIDV